MQGKQQKSSLACTGWLIAGAVSPLGALIARPFALVGAVVVLFAFVIAAIEVQH